MCKGVRERERPQTCIKLSKKLCDVFVMQAIMLSCIFLTEIAFKFFFFFKSESIKRKEAMCNVANAFALFHQIIKAKRKVHEMTKCYIRDFQPSKKMEDCQNEQRERERCVKWKGEKCMQ